MEDDMTVEETTPDTWGRKIFEVLFLRRVSVAIIAFVLLVAISSLPNLGVVIGWGFLLLALLLCIRQRSFAEIGFSRPESWPRTLASGLGLGVLLQTAFVVVIDPLAEHLAGSAVDISMLDPMRGNLVNFIIMLVVGWVIGGFLEEMLFRGYLLKRLKIVFGDGPVSVATAVLLPAVAFGLAHSYQGPAGMLSTGLMGLMLGVIFVLNDYNIWLPILVHGFVDMVGLTLIYLDADTWMSHLIF